MVIFQSPDGNPGYNQFDTVEAAVAFVEQLRNTQGVSNARMFALEELKFDFKPYYRVELAALTAGEAPAAAPASGPATAPSAASADASASTDTSASADAPAPPLSVVPPAPAPGAAAPGAAAAAAPTDDLSSPVGSAPASEGDADGEPQLRRGLFGR